MRKFDGTTFVFALFSLVVFAITGYLYVSVSGIDLDYLPPPRIGNNIGFNDKLLFANNKSADHVAIGSSMTLYNINSESVITNLGSDNYLNLASWGLSIEDTYTLLRNYVKFNQPKTVIVSSNLFDFCKKQIQYNPDELEQSLTCGYPNILYLKHPEIRYYLSNTAYYKSLKTSKSVYESLVYDKYGGVSYADKLDSYVAEKWNETQDELGIDPINYSCLDSMAKFAQHQNIRLIFCQSPFREGLYDKIDRSNLQNHIQKVENIISKYRMEFANATEKRWADSLFIDGTHLTGTGSKLYTDYCLGHLHKASLISDNQKQNFDKTKMTYK